MNLAETKDKKSLSNVESSRLYRATSFHHPNRQNSSKGFNQKIDMQITANGAFTPYSDVDSPKKLTR